jgi:hypothetical protein
MHEFYRIAFRKQLRDGPSRPRRMASGLQAAAHPPGTPRFGRNAHAAFADSADLARNKTETLKGSVAEPNGGFPSADAHHVGSMVHQTE